MMFIIWGYESRAYSVQFNYQPSSMVYTLSSIVDYTAPISISATSNFGGDFKIKCVDCEYTYTLEDIPTIFPKSKFIKYVYSHLPWDTNTTKKNKIKLLKFHAQNLLLKNKYKNIYVHSLPQKRKISKQGNFIFSQKSHAT